MRLNYTKFPFFDYFKRGVAFPFLIVVALPLLIQEEGCDRKYDKPPGCTSLTNPAADSMDVASEAVKITWAKTARATAYRLKVGTTSGGNDLLDKDMGALTDTVLENLPKGQQIFVAVTPYNSYGSATLCQESSFTTVKPVLPPPACVQFTGPEDGATQQEINVRMSWQSASNHDGYHLRIGTSDGNWNILNEKLGKNVTSYSNLNLAYETDIVAKVVPFNAAGEADACGLIRFTTKESPPIPPPACVKLLNPENGATDVSINTSIRWEKGSSGNVNGYKLKIGTAAGKADIADTDFSGLITSYKPENPLPENATIYVQVIPHNEVDAVNCTEESFTTGSTSDTSTPPGATTAKYVRKNVAELDFNDPVLVTYRDAIKKMKALPADDPHSWAAQAKIHHDHCPHGGWFFLPWHRAYLYYFEETIREVSGDDSFALPYWDWTKNPKIPAAFWGDDNEMYNERGKGPNDVPDDSYVGQEEIDDILSTEDFGLFASSQSRSGALESAPHNYIHGWVGGEMGFVNSAGRDPLFWCHHANVDRLWAMWNEYGNANTDDNSWMNHIFNKNFADRTKREINISVADVISTYSLNYRYDTQSETAPNTAWQSLPVSYTEIEGMRSVKGIFPSAKIDAPFTVSMEPDAGFLSRVNELLSAPPGDIPEAVFLLIDSIAPPAEEDIFFNVFVNHDNISTSTKARDYHHVTSFGFFRMGTPSNNRDHGNHGEGDMGSYIFDMTATLRAIREETGAPLDKIEIQLIAVPFSGEASDATFSPGKFMIQLAEKS